MGPLAVELVGWTLLRQGRVFDTLNSRPPARPPENVFSIAVHSKMCQEAEVAADNLALANQDLA